MDDQLSERPLGEPGMLIDPTCARILSGFLGGYYYPEIRGRPGSFRDAPIKNIWSHVQDGVQYITVKIRGNEVKGSEDDFDSDYGRPTDPMCIF